MRYDCSLRSSCLINESVHPDDQDWQGQWDAEIDNLSVTGIGLLLSRRFEPGSLLLVDLTSSDGKLKRTVEVRVVRVAPVEGGGWYLGGAMAEKLGKEELRRFL